MRTSLGTCRPAIIKHGSIDVRAIRQVSSPKVKGRPAPGYKATAQGNFADRDEGLDRDAQTLSSKCST